MLPKSNKPGQLYGTAKTHKFTNIDEIAIDNLKFHPIIAQTGTYTYNAVQVIAKYLKPLCSGNNYIIRNMQEFPMSLKQQDPSSPDKEYVSYDVESLFTNVPVHETIDYILQEIYVKEKLPKICSKLIMKQLSLKLTTENTFMLNSNFYKQIDCCTMGGPLSVIFSDIYMTKTEEEVVKPTNPSFYTRFVDDIISKKKKDQPGLLFENLNNHHPNIKYTTETMPQKFLDTKIIYEDNQIKTKVHRNERKLPVHWTSKIPKRYKRNAISADLNRAAQIASTFPEEIPTIKQKFLSADYPPRFNSVIKQFDEKCNGNTQDDYIILPDFFDVPKLLVLTDILYCPRNETLSKRFIKKSHEFTSSSLEIRIKWITKKVKQLFKLKSKNPHPLCVI